jgi:electron transport complex protein RnfD
MDKHLIAAHSPHLHSGDSVQKNMAGVIVALLPALAVALYFFGVGALIVTATSVAACIATEYVIQKYLLKQSPTINDGSAVVTGLLLAFCLPSNLPVWIIIIGAIVAIGVAKMSFGGLGNNPFNPALVGRVFLLISFPVQMTSWPKADGWNSPYLDAVTAATPLGVLNGENVNMPELVDMLVGKMGGSLGEASVIAIALGAAWLLVRKIISWHIPVSILASAAVLAEILYLIDPTQFLPPVVHLCTGGLLLGAVFMATDYVTSPMTHKGMIAYGVGIGVITVIIRSFGAYPEGVSFAILIMNAATPLIDMIATPKRYGTL